MIYVITKEIEFTDLYDDSPLDIEDIILATSSKEKAEAKLLELNEHETRARTARRECRSATNELYELQFPKFSHSIFREIFRPGKEKELRVAFEDSRKAWQVKYDAKRQEIATKFDVEVDVLDDCDRVFRIKEFEEDQ